MVNKFLIILFFCFACSLEHAAQTNIDFEQTLPGAYTTSNAVSGWTISSQTATGCINSPIWAAGSPEFSVVTAPLLNALPISQFLIGTLPVSPLGGNNVIKLNNASANGLRTKIKQTFNVTIANTLLQYAFAGVWEGGNHLCCEEAGLAIKIYDCTGNLINCPTTNVNAVGSSCTNGALGYLVSANNTWTNWRVLYYDLSPYIGSCITIDITNSDCSYGTHFGTTYFDCKIVSQFLCVCNMVYGNATPASFCPGSSIAQIYAPLGYASYQWYAPSSPTVPVSSQFGGNTPVLTATNAVAGAIYTVQMTSAAGCLFTAVDTLNYSSVFVAGIGSNSTCPNGASGTATVLGGGSSVGYNYNWTNSLGLGIGTTSVITGLSPGIYSVQISATGSLNCGSASATVAIGVAPNAFFAGLGQYCGTQATLSAPLPGSNYQWYYNNTAIPSAQNGTLSAYTVTAPVNNSNYYLRYTTFQGCNDSIKFILFSLPSGTIAVSNISMACPGLNNASATINITPAMPTPGPNSFSVYSVPLGFTASLSPTTSHSFIATGMGAGAYSVSAQVGICSYTTSFNVIPYLFNYAVTPVTSTICAGSIYAGVSFTNAIVPGQYTFSWSPATWITGGSVNTANTVVQINPVLTLGSQATTIYTITVTPSIVNCPLSKTISVSAANPVTPTITPVPPFCTSTGLKPVIFAPTGGTFSTSTGVWIMSGSGLINSSTCPIGTNTFVYTTTLGGCTASATTSIVVSIFRKAALTSSLINLCVNAGCFNLMSLPQNSSGTWSGQGIISNTFCSTSSAGSYTAVYNTTSWPNPTICPDSDTLLIQVNNPITPTITTSGPFCTNGPTVQLFANPPTGSFVAGPLINSAGSFTPSNFVPGVYTVQYNNCNLLATRQITVLGYIPATLTASLNSHCVSDPPFNLSSLAVNASGFWSGPGVTGNLFDATSAGTGSHTLTYVTSLQPGNLCPSQATIILSVDSLPILSILGNTIICSGESATLTLSGASSYSLNNVSASTVNIVAPSSTTVYVVTGFQNNCKGSKSFTVDVSACTSIADLIDGKSGIKVYPNPTDGNINIELPFTSDISVINELGQIISQFSLDAGFRKIDLSKYNNGIYTLKCVMPDRIQIVKLIKTN